MAKLVKANGEITEIDVKGKDCLAIMQKAVGGMIQWVHSKVIIDGVKYTGGLVCNEEGKMMGLPFNEKATLIWGNRYDILVGDVIFLKRGEMK